MSDRPEQVPLEELARSIPKDLRAEWETQWADDGTPTGHSMAPVGKYVHELLDKLEAKDRRIAELEGEVKRFRCDFTHCQWRLRGEKAEADNERLRGALRLIESPGDITTPEELAYVASEALAAVGEASDE